MGWKVIEIVYCVYSHTQPLWFFFPPYWLIELTMNSGYSTESEPITNNLKFYKTFLLFFLLSLIAHKFASEFIHLFTLNSNWQLISFWITLSNGNLNILPCGNENWSEHTSWKSQVLFKNCIWTKLKRRCSWFPEKKMFTCPVDPSWSTQWQQNQKFTDIQKDIPTKCD